MMIIRPIASADLPALMQLIKLAGVGLTTLPSNEADGAAHRRFQRVVRRHRAKSR